MAADFSLYSGDSKTLNVSIRDEAGVAVDVSDAVGITYAIFKVDGTEVVTKTLVDGITVVTSVVTVTLEPADTMELLAAKYIHEMQITTADGAVSTVLQGDVVLRKGYID